MPPRSSLYRLANDRMDGRLPDRLRALREAGHTWFDIAVELSAAGVRVSPETLRVWAKQLGVGNGEAA